jgi:hypothetical protein
MPRACLTKSPAVALAGFAVAALAMPMAVFGQTLTVYGTAAGQAGPAYPGGTIVAGDTVRIDDGGSITGAVSNSDTLQFNQKSGSLSLTTYTASAVALAALGVGLAGWRMVGRRRRDRDTAGHRQARKR